MQFWIPAGENNAGGFHQAEMMLFWITAGGNDAVIDFSRQQ